MATAQPSTASNAFEGDLARVAQQGARVFGDLTVDLTTLGSATRMYPVMGLTSASARVNANIWGTAIVAVTGSMDGENFSALPIPINLSVGTIEVFDFSIQGRLFVRFEVTTKDVAASQDARVHLYPYRPANPINSLAGQGLLLNVQVITATGTYAKTAGATKAIVMMLAGGGGGGGCAFAQAARAAAAGGGGAGGMAIAYVTSGLGGQTVTIGAGGVGGAAGANNGAAGGTSSFAALASATGGTGGTAMTGGLAVGVVPGGAGGLGSLGIVNCGGSPGVHGTRHNGTTAASGCGGSSPYGGGGLGIIVEAAGNPGQNYGSGGGGACTLGTADQAGGNGSPGVGIIYEYT